MAVSLTRFSWLWWGGKEKEKVSTGSTMKNPLPDWGIGLKESDNLKFKSSVKWKNREEKMIDKEYDVVLVPADGVCLSCSESDDSDWSIGWLEPHAPDFQNDDSFAVLVPCYKHEEEDEVEPTDPLLSNIRNLPNEFSSESKNYVEQWLSSLENV